MRRSEDIGELAAALAKAQGSMETVKKGSTNPFFNSTYADLADVVEAVKPHLSENGLAVVQMPETQDGKPVLTTMLMHSSGQFVMGTLELVVQKNDMQAFGSATTYARRYQYSGVTGAAADADDDGNAASGTTHDDPPVRRSTGTQPGSQVAKRASESNDATEAQWKYLAKLTNQSVESCRAQYGEMNAAACSTLIESLKEDVA